MNMNAISPGNKIDHVPEVPRALDYQASAVAETKNLIGILQGRLSAIVSQSAPRSEKDGERGAPFNSGIATVIHSHTNAIREINSALECLLDDLQV